MIPGEQLNQTILESTSEKYLFKLSLRQLAGVAYSSYIHTDDTNRLLAAELLASDEYPEYRQTFDFVRGDHHDLLTAIVAYDTDSNRIVIEDPGMFAVTSINLLRQTSDDELVVRAADVVIKGYDLFDPFRD